MSQEAKQLINDYRKWVHESCENIKKKNSNRDSVYECYKGNGFSAIISKKINPSS